MATYRLFPTNPTPATPDAAFTGAITVGVRFRVTAVANAVAVWFYKPSTNTGTHIGAIWTDAGVLQGQVTFTGETASGWQRMALTTPIALTVNAYYRVGVYMPAGHFSRGTEFGGTSITNGLLEAPSLGSGNQQPAYITGTGLQFPNLWETSTSHYAVDVEVADAGPPPVTLTGSTKQAQAVALQVCAPNRYTNLETLTYAQLETFTYGQLELQCGNLYSQSVNAQQAQSLQLGRSLSIRRTLTQGQALALSLSRVLGRVVSTTQAQTLALSVRRAVLRTVSLSQAQAVSVAVNRVSVRIVALSQAQSLRLLQAASLRRATTQPTLVSLVGSSGRALLATAQTTVALVRQLRFTRTVTQSQIVSRVTGQGYQRTVTTTQGQSVALLKLTQLARLLSVSTAVGVARGAARVVAVVQTTQAALVQQSRLTRAVTQAQSVSQTRIRVVLAVLSVTQAQSLALGRAVSLTRSVTQAMAARVTRSFGLAVTLVEPTILTLGQGVRLSRQLGQSLLVALGLTNVTQRYELTVALQVRQVLDLRVATTGLPARVFQVCPSRTIMFSMCQRQAHFAATRRGVQFTVEVR